MGSQDTLVGKMLHKRKLNSEVSGERGMGKERHVAKFNRMGSKK